MSKEINVVLHIACAKSCLGLQEAYSSYNVDDINRCMIELFISPLE